MTAPSRSEPAPPRRPLDLLELAPSGPSEAPPSPARGPSARPARAFRRGMVTIACELRTQRVVQFYRRDFTPISHWLDALDRARDFRHVDTRTASEAEHLISAHLAAVQHLFHDSTLRIEALLAAQGLANVPIRYADPVTVAAPIVHPLAHVYLRVLSVADDAFSALERAWLLGLVDTRARRGEEARFRKALRGIATLVREQYSQMARLLRESRGGAASEFAEPAEPAEPGDPAEPPAPAPRHPIPWWRADEAHAGPPLS